MRERKRLIWISRVKLGQGRVPALLRDSTKTSTVGAVHPTKGTHVLLKQSLALTAAILGLAASRLLAQTAQAGDLDPSGRVMTRIVVTMTEAGAFGHPVGALTFLIVSENSDRISVRTNDAGVASSWLKPGTYRIVNPSAAEWSGRAYTWDIVSPVRAGMGVIRLSQENATKVGPIGEAAIGAPSTFPPSPVVAVPPSSRPSSLDASKSTVIRSGFWFNLGLGYGVFSCDVCDGSLGGVSGNLALGGTITPRFLLGVGTTGWVKSEEGVTLSAGTLDARMRFYPSTTGNFFLTAGVGVGSVSLDLAQYGSFTETGVGVVLGLGYDFRVGKNASITPFWNGIGIQTPDEIVSVGQIGIGFTLH